MFDLNIKKKKKERREKQINKTRINKVVLGTQKERERKRRRERERTQSAGGIRIASVETNKPATL